MVFGLAARAKASCRRRLHIQNALKMKQSKYWIEASSLPPAAPLTLSHTGYDAALFCNDPTTIFSTKWDQVVTVVVTFR